MEELLTPAKGHNMRAKNNSAAAVCALSCKSKNFPAAQLGKNESHSGMEAHTMEACHQTPLPDANPILLLRIK